MCLVFTVLLYVNVAVINFYRLKLLLIVKLLVCLHLFKSLSIRYV